VQSDPPQLPFLWTVGIATRETLKYLDRRGIDAAPLLSKAELSRAQLALDSGGISVTSQHRFLELAANETNDPLLGLHVAAGWTCAMSASSTTLRRLRRPSPKLLKRWPDIRRPQTKKLGSRSLTATIIQL